MSKLYSAVSALCEYLGERKIRALCFAYFLNVGKLGGGIGVEAVYCYHYGKAVFAKIVYMSFKVDSSCLERIEIFARQLCLWNSAVIFKRSYSCDENHRVGRKPCLPALDVKEFFGSEIGSEACLGYSIVAKLKRKLCCSYRVTAVSYICKGTAVNERGCVLYGLDEVGLYRILEQSSHSSVCAKLFTVNGRARIRVGYENVAEPFLEVGYRLRKAKNSHYLACYRYHKFVLTRNSVCL